MAKRGKKGQKGAKRGKKGQKGAKRCFVFVVVITNIKNVITEIVMLREFSKFEPLSNAKYLYNIYTS